MDDKMNNKIPFLLLTLTSSSAIAYQPSISSVLKQEHKCSPTIQIRSEKLSQAQISQACALLSKQEAKFHELFGTISSPVKDDNNASMRANIYADRDSYVKHVTDHFDVPSDNGGMYLEGYPNKKDNQAEFVAYEKNGQIWNLAHEYIHYLDGRFNLHGDFCSWPHDSHGAPEYCPKPAPVKPHLVWWTEGLAEYISKGDNNPKAFETAKSGEYKLSDLFNTSYENDGGSVRIYRWGYLATRFMLENHRAQVDAMLKFTRKGEYDKYQKLVTLWGTRYDAEFSTWLKKIEKK
ncbi:collagenase [Shewanella sp. OPT22]|nr:collagenase [Shewanella sp. OPT22]